MKVSTRGVLTGMVLAAVLILLGAIPAGAANLDPPRATAQPFADAPVQVKSWTGAYFGLHAGSGFANTEVGGSALGGLGFDGIGSHGWVAGVTAGYDLQFSGSALVLGVRGSYGWGDVKTEITPGQFSASIKDGWSADGRVGYAMGTALPYIFAGYGTSHTEAAIGGKAIANTPDLEGMRLGAGVEFRLPNMGTGAVIPTLAIEYVHIDFDTLTYKVGSKNVTFDTTEQAVMGRLNLRFGN